ncbi:MAG: hypothetical protein E5Y10_22160 [Mesorhizobium sp.]|uniref:hypothetical protein n=1 Tax=Mesorhizobium sp. TaxID=1871066 RepID=UPI0011FDB74B|nr:hypothetical protein [Mesorhizobium sp.]TIN36834.1 MAG: hypothetical protein E5Y13_22770 [Mesorhizobium sp.]TIN76764.1 MAG: hypothetical protein E5Y09_20970 [Mesorhizobium sp.]TJU73562.1 MAG: hypothetical protein E5Y15_32620 [Mesorhizobium sp.]TJU86679.1 MAG: hypothetical protein E5Y10_22160 [Mesorhizobium sp.]
MGWKPIAELTEDEFEGVLMHNRMMLSNSCNGPYHLTSASNHYLGAWEIQVEGVWEKYLVLPDAAA